MTKMNDRVPKEALDSSRFNAVSLKICAFDPTPKFQELEIGFD